MESVFGEKKFRGVGETRTTSSDLAVCGVIAYWKGLFFIKNRELGNMNKFDNLIKKHEFNSFINY